LTEIQIWELAAIFVMVAMFYSSVGHAGASGYLAAMAIVGVAPELMRPTALTLNIVIAAFTTWRFRSARFFDVRIVGAFLVGSVPMAFIGGGIKLPTEIYKMLVGVVLLCSATYLVWRGYAKKFRSVPIAETPLTVPMFIAPFIGAAVGLRPYRNRRRHLPFTYRSVDGVGRAESDCGYRRTVYHGQLGRRIERRPVQRNVCPGDHTRRRCASLRSGAGRRNVGHMAGSVQTFQPTADSYACLRNVDCRRKVARSYLKNRQARRWQRPMPNVPQG
jgi:hypothetical protein